jgi:outer membrane protein assembly factor BamC
MSRPLVNTSRHAALILSCAGLFAGCSTVSDIVTPAKVDYRTATVKQQPLDVPPDLTQLSNDPRYQPAAGGSISAAAIQAATPTARVVPAAGQSAGTVAPIASGSVRVERAGSQRWLVVAQTPEQLWPQLQNFWTAAGFSLVTDKPDLGVMETDWAENRAKLPQDVIRRTIGRFVEGLYDSGERDRFRLRVERSATSNSTEVYLSHRGATEMKVGTADERRDATRWQVHAGDPQIEAEMLSRLMLFLAPPAQVAATAPATAIAAEQAALAAAASAVAKAPDAPARARLLEGRPAASLQVDDDFARAWRRVGLALDRNGFTVEDRDRGQGLYYVRYVDPKLAGKEEPGFLTRLFTSAKKEDFSGTRYRVGVQAEGKSTVVAVFDAQGTPQNSESARNIVQLLLGELR